MRAVWNFIFRLLPTTIVCLILLFLFFPIIVVFAVSFSSAKLPHLPTTRLQLEMVRGLFRQYRLAGINLAQRLDRWLRRAVVHNAWDTICDRHLTPAAASAGCCDRPHPIAADRAGDRGGDRYLLHILSLWPRGHADRRRAGAHVPRGTLCGDQRHRQPGRYRSQT